MHFIKAVKWKERQYDQELQSNLSGSDTSETMKISSRQG